MSRVMHLPQVDGWWTLVAIWHDSTFAQNNMHEQATAFIQTLFRRFINFMLPISPCNWSKKCSLHIFRYKCDIVQSVKIVNGETIIIIMQKYLLIVYPTWRILPKRDSTGILLKMYMCKHYISDTCLCMLATQFFPADWYLDYKNNYFNALKLKLPIFALCLVVGTIMRFKVRLIIL